MILERKQILTYSNALSLLRLLMVFPILYCLSHLQFENYRYLTIALCLIAAATDFLDGYIARKRNEITEFGKILDPLADKILIGAIAIKLFLICEVSQYYLLIILIRDAIILLGGIFISKRIKKVLPSNLLGKITVTVIALVFLMIIIGIDKQSLIYQIFYNGSIALIYLSLAGYAIRGYEFLKKNGK